MTTILLKKDPLEFGVTTTFEGPLLAPVIKNVLLKVETWDDYDEVWHCTRLIESVRKTRMMQMDFHFIRQDKQIIGLLLATSGDLDYKLFFQETAELESKTEEVVIFNYFHIAPEGRGNGYFWLKEIILPYYQAKGLRKAYIKSSHPRVFSMYHRLGRSIGSYTGLSDNRLFERQGKVFEICLDGR